MGLHTHGGRQGSQGWHLDARAVHVLGDLHVEGGVREPVLGDSVFFYSSGLFNHQCVSSNQAINTAGNCTKGNYVNYAADATGKATFQEGSLGGSATAGATSYPSIDKSACPLATIPVGEERMPAHQQAVLTNSFPSVRYVYNVYSNGSSTAVPAATPATLAYISENGFLCSPRTVNQTNPLDGKTYRDDIKAAILGSGFYPLSAGARPVWSTPRRKMKERCRITPTP